MKELIINLCKITHLSILVMMYIIVNATLKTIYITNPKQKILLCISQSRTNYWHLIMKWTAIFFYLQLHVKPTKFSCNLLKMSIYFYVHPSTHYFPKKQFCRKKVTNLELEIHHFIKQSKKNFLKMNCVALAKHPSRSKFQTWLDRNYQSSAGKMKFTLL